VTIGGPFTLSAPDGTTVTDQTYRGKWLLVYFGYTFCPNSCPTMLLEIATALKKLGPDAAKVQPLFITVDPQRDTPEVMQQFTQSFDPRIVGSPALRSRSQRSPRNTASTPSVTGLDLAPKTTSWTIVPTFTLWTLEANLSAPSTPTPQTIASPTRCVNSWQDLMKDRQDGMQSSRSAEQVASR
jgi:hypothetical protein